MLKIVLYLYCSGNDNLLPSKDEAHRLKSSLKNCKVRFFKDNGHSMLMVSEKKWCILVSRISRVTV
jgi:hypothetical protein